MRKIFLTSDCHFYHSNIIRFENRPFKNVEEMNATLIQNWNKAVSKNDIIYILGDFSFAGVESTKEVLNQLNGEKHLIIGNHDCRWLNKQDINNCFKSIQPYLELKYNNQFFIMMHYPLASWNGMYRGAVHLYGHVHSNPVCEGFNYNRSYNVGMDTNNYTPVALDSIIEKLGDN